MSRKIESLTVDERRLLAYALCALEDACPAEHKAALQIDMSLLATKLGILNELSIAISAGQAARGEPA